MAYITGLTRNKKQWTPNFISAIDKNSCIGCGRCHKGCAHNVLSFVELEGDDPCKMYMMAKYDGNCIGCGACGITCPQKCITFEQIEE